MISEADTGEKIFQNHVLSVCNALGGYEQDAYVPGDEAYDCLRDLKRFIKMDENEGTKNSHFLLGKWNIMTSDLIPLFLHSASDPDISKESMRMSLGSLDVMVSLTMPLKEVDVNQNQFYKTYKGGFLKTGFWKGILNVIVCLLSTPQNKRDELHKQKFLLPITLIRNILAIDDIQESTAMSNNQYVKSKLQEELVEKMHQEGVIEFILSLASSVGETEFRSLNTITLEIFHHIFFGRNISDFFQTIATEKSNLQDMLQKERNTRQVQINNRKPNSSRHPRFGGTFAVKTHSGQQVHTTSVPTHIGASLDKTKKLNTRNAKYEFDNVIEKPFVLHQSIATHKEILQSFYENCFSVLAASVKRDFDIDSTSIVDEDYRHYFSVLGIILGYFLELSNNQRSFECIAGVINYPTVFLIFKKLDMYRNEKNWKDLQLTLVSFRNMILTIDLMYKSNLNDLIDLSVQLLSNLFYEQGNIHLLVGLTRDSAPRGQKYLQVLAETIHTIFELLKNNFNNGIVIRRKVDKPADGDGDSDNENHYQQSSERVMSVSQFENVNSSNCQLFAYESVIATYTSLLVHFEYLSDKYIQYILEMFECISNTHQCDKEALLYQAPLLQLFNQIVHSPISKTTKFTKIVAFINLITSAAIKRLAENPTLILELFFSKTRSDCLRIMNDQYQFDTMDGDLEFAGFPEYMMFNHEIMRLVMYDDLDDFNINLEQGALVSDFVWESAAPYDAEEYFEKQSVQYLMGLLGFTKYEQTWKFPPEIELETIENLENLSLFSKTTKVGKGIKRNAKVLETNQSVNIEFETESTGMQKQAVTSVTENKNLDETIGEPSEQTAVSPVVQKKRARIIEFSDED
ncbi:Topoisomerase 1-associated factor 1 [Terramyces sp. JEL0728]|nr:Topoisomerase 1-associated factor 1 [Terramyces sp. JEL0728]